MTVFFTEDAEDDLKRLGREVASRIVTKCVWFAEHFETQIPLPLGGRYKGFYKLRVGDWRAIYEIDRDTDRLITHIVDHRSKIYKR